MRIRNIKPEFVKHEGLAELSRDHRLFFLALWMLCDVEGRCEDRPKRIKAELFPYDDDVTSATIDDWLSDLAAKGFVERYEVGGVRVVLVPTLPKHQAFSTWEKKTRSELPPPPGQQEGHDVAAEEREEQSGSESEHRPQDYSSPPAALPPDEGRGTKDEGQRTKDEGGAAAPAHLGFGPEQLAERWNAVVGGRIQLTAERTAAARKALKRRPDPAWWEACLAKVAALKSLPESQWLKLDWLLSAKKRVWNYDRVADGEFDWKLQGGAAIPFRPRPPVGGLPRIDTPPQQAPSVGEERLRMCLACGNHHPAAWDGQGWVHRDHGCAEGARMHA